RQMQIVLIINMLLSINSNEIIILYISSIVSIILFFFNDPATTEIYTLSLHDALPICLPALSIALVDDQKLVWARGYGFADAAKRSEEHTSELQSPCNLVCRLLLEKKNIDRNTRYFFRNRALLAVSNTAI